jgi:hypothetical protein
VRFDHFATVFGRLEFGVGECGVDLLLGQAFKFRDEPRYVRAGSDQGRGFSVQRAFDISRPPPSASVPCWPSSPRCLWVCWCASAHVTIKVEREQLTHIARGRDVSVSLSVLLPTSVSDDHSNDPISTTTYLRWRGRRRCPW